MFPNVDPEQLRQAQIVGSKINCAVRIQYDKDTIQIMFHAVEPDAKTFIVRLLEQFGLSLAEQLSTFFAIKGEILETGKKK